MWFESTAPDPQAALWGELVGAVQAGTGPAFEDQWALFERLAAERTPDLSPMPAWWPDENRVGHSNVGRSRPGS